MKLSEGVWVRVMAGMLLLACSSSDKQDSLPVERCKEFASTWCKHSLDCIVQVGRLSSSQEPDQLDACNRVAVAAVPCDKAVGVGTAFDQCENEVDAMPCQTWDVETSQLSTITPPSSCVG